MLMSNGKGRNGSHRQDDPAPSLAHAGHRAAGCLTYMGSIDEIDNRRSLLPKGGDFIGMSWGDVPAFYPVTHR